MKPVSKLITRFDAATAGETSTFSDIDTLGYDYAIVDVLLVGTEATNPPTVLILSSGDSTSSYTAISTGGGSGDNDFVLPTAITTLGAEPTSVRFARDLRAEGRYLKLAVASATVTSVVATVNLFHGDLAPDTATKASVDKLVTF